MLWRREGRQRSLTFESLPAAERFKVLLEDHGPDEALRIIELDEIGCHVPTVTEWLHTHIDNLTGVQPATIARYRSYVARDVDPVFGSMAVSAVTDTTIARWVKQLGGSGKTISNKHGFLSGALSAAVRAGVMASNPCQGRRMPHTRVEETIFLTPPEFILLRGHIEKQRWKNLSTWLVTTGMRFSEATALTAADIDADASTCRITKAWKYSGNYRPEIGFPKTRKSIRTISLPDAALEVIDLTALGFLFTNGAGNPVRAQEFFNGGWKPGRDSAMKAGLAKSPRVRDLRHTCASWMIAAGVPLPIIQQHLGHESIQTTIGVYGHLDRRSAQVAADAIGSALG
ncbi:MAG: site-specific recombinase XerD [Mycobacterium sp.]|nr:site-specific recombinase XerD [Mycobacterium sp.]